MNDTVLNQLLHPSKLWSRVEVLQRPSPVPREAGVHGWYFREIPPDGEGSPRSASDTSQLDENAFVCWAPHADPRSQEEQLIQRLVLPLNLEGSAHPFRPVLSALRSAAKQTAALLPIA